MRRRGDTGIYHRRSGGLSYGNRWGVVMLDFDSPFVPGDMGNASTYTTPALFERVPDLSVDAILSDDDSAFARRVIDAAVALVNRGATAITSNCGFMIRYQAAVADALNGVPVVLSSLMQLPFIAATIPAGGRVGIVTASDRVLTSEFIGNTFPGLGERVLIAGLQDAPHFHATMFAGSDDLNADGIREEVVEAVHRLLGDAPPYPTAR
ncbi:MAG: aspartate racemase, partial [Cryobacterium sp.]|nr:aspartate racemase [Cryobacterium sp.]